MIYRRYAWNKGLCTPLYLEEVFDPTLNKVPVNFVTIR